MTEGWLFIFILVLLCGIVALAEFSLATAKRAKLEPFLKKGSKNARFVLDNHGRQGNLQQSLQLFGLFLKFSTGITSVALWRLQLAFFADSEQLFSLVAPPAWRVIPVSFMLSVFPCFILLHLFAQVFPLRISAINPEKQQFFSVRLSA